jgi:hypothetical protein
VGRRDRRQAFGEVGPSRGVPLYDPVTGGIIALPCRRAAGDRQQHRRECDPRHREDLVIAPLFLKCL